MELKVLSIDIGIINLGYVYATLHFDESTKSSSKFYLDQNFDIRVLDCDRINITNIKHSKVNYCDCKLNHEYCIPDYLDHFIQEHLEYFENANLILIERQPPVGITNVQDLIFTRFRSKILMVSPGSVHKYFVMSKDYSKRKLESEKIATKYLCSFNKYYNNTRKHDIADAMLMIIYYYSIKSNEFSRNRNIKKVILDFEQFRFSKV
jgi:hypothetical protein